MGGHASHYLWYFLLPVLTYYIFQFSLFLKSAFFFANLSLFFGFLFIFPQLFRSQCIHRYLTQKHPDTLSDNLRVALSVTIGTIQRRLAWPLRKDDTQNREALPFFAAGFTGTHGLCTRCALTLCALFFYTKLCWSNR